MRARTIAALLPELEHEPVRTLARACPHCHEVQDAATQLGGEGHAVPNAGDVVICSLCGGVGMVSAGGALEKFDPAEIEDEENRKLVERASAVGRARAVGRRRAKEKEASARLKLETDLGAGYVASAERLDRFLADYLAREGPELRFALPPDEILVPICLDHAAPRIARNDAARAFCFAACENVPDGKQPTILMLAAALDCHGIPYERVSLTELGYAVPTA